MNEKTGLLIIGDKNEFLLRNVSNKMQSELIDVVVTEPDINKISSVIKTHRYILIFVESAASLKEVFVFLKDAAFDLSLKISLIGEVAELNEVPIYLKDENIERTFERPVDSKIICEGLLHIIKKSENESRMKSILVIDDDPVFLKRTQSILKNLYKVFVVNSGTSAIMLLTKHKVDLILLDYEMPVASGPQVYEMIKAEPELSSIPIMFLTGKSDIFSVTHASLLNPAKYLLKTLPVQELTDTLAEFFKKQPEWTAV